VVADFLPQFLDVFLNVLGHSQSLMPADRQIIQWKGVPLTVRDKWGEGKARRAKTSVPQGALGVPVSSAPAKAAQSPALRHQSHLDRGASRLLVSLSEENK
jgi:hypothetical protein